jgi:hypothetical protein
LIQCQANDKSLPSFSSQSARPNCPFPANLEAVFIRLQDAHSSP